MRPYDGLWVSILVTPWFIDVMLLPGSEEEVKPGAAIDLEPRFSIDFPAGSFEFICGAEPELGPYRMCSLFSPVLQFENQDAALAAAEARHRRAFRGRAPPALR